MYNLGFPEITIMLVLAAILVFEVAMFIHMLTNSRFSLTAKVVWGIAMLVIHPFVALYYFFTEYRKTKHTESSRAI